MIQRLLIVFLFLLQCSLKAQLPNTDIWLFPVYYEKKIPALKKGINITQREGYDNQPQWDPNGKQLFFVSIKEDRQSDVYYYDTGKKKIQQLTKTPESEYSPTPIDKHQLACVVVEKDSTQRIWTYDKTSGIQQTVLFNEDSIGYFFPLNTDTILYYKLTSPHSLRAHHIKTHEDNWLCNHPVRGFKQTNDQTFIYGIKDSGMVVFYRYNPHIKKAHRICDYPSLNEDIFWHKQWGLLKSEGVCILQWDALQKTWKTLFDLKPFGIKRITRFCFDPKNNYLTIVDNL